MKRKRFRGVTLPELLVVMGIVGIIGTVTTILFVRTTGVYSRTSANFGPQSAEALALKRMEFEMREAMFVSVVTPTPATWVEICLPKTDNQGINTIFKGQEGILGLVRDPALDTSYFLGKKEYPNAGNKTQWNAIPDGTGDTIFKALSSTKTADGKFPNAEVIVEGILSTPMIPDPKNPGNETPGRLFEYWPADPNDPTRPTVDSQLIRVTMTVPITTKSLTGVVTTNHTMRTQFCLRNWNSSQLQ